MKRTQLTAKEVGKNDGRQSPYLLSRCISRHAVRCYDTTQNAEKTDIFVQDVTCAPEPMAVLCNDQQLCDIAHFCCDPFSFCIFGIDPTFEGDFSVNPTVYWHLLVQDPQTGRSTPLIGPMLVHYHKLYRSYNYFLPH